MGAHGRDMSAHGRDPQKYSRWSEKLAVIAFSAACSRAQSGCS